ncbi:hypothetical protein SeLEV6574_g05824 [Synchytrium endobioticum]|uniref:Uncharacterized protein n=1 Tax=Synchytrium endobioticum TaxID=286115 RepID=A0A507CS21_9FUNG|nr:hypothetical protein SeLEV6574_g05824 [Synchytrium endobioticum]
MHPPIKKNSPSPFLQPLRISKVGNPKELNYCAMAKIHLFLLLAVVLSGAIVRARVHPIGDPPAEAPPAEAPPVADPPAEAPPVAAPPVETPPAEAPPAEAIEYYRDDNTGDFDLESGR